VALSSARGEFVSQWEPRIGASAAKTAYRCRTYRVAAPVAGLGCIAFAFLASLAGPVAVVAAVLCWAGFAVAAVRSAMLNHAAHRQAESHLGVTLKRGHSVPMRSIESFDRWWASKVGERG
jgi:hypothetical protein